MNLLIPKTKLPVCYLLYLFVLAAVQNNVDGVDSSDIAILRTVGVGMPHSCPFVYKARMPSAQDGLINCTWYSSNACCKRTEVTSVFSGMLPLDTPSTMDKTTAKHCRNLMNYMMCYFCDPNQASWYNRTLNVCEGFCEDVYSYCGKAGYSGKTIGEQFASGAEFCEAQTFRVIPGDQQCFKFDPTVFDASERVAQSFLLMTFCVLVFILY
ncbi:hypothetical protein EB796_017964 [Bugula neritina]|uniref:Folate receptor-like domain-containing protein n=1 Tax=Bugula neritina TaxID=10212 RepID=A0A7J7JBU5_BUGNE|nr:hypothetical protein EB796_017964 [Bugula neritina]